ncbi:MAG TPA: hypothetical protein VFQ53_06725 [Kofleriaceae bacterium]|nr:hypothetical protein [Kofleriaceae bacterium]
MGRPWAVCVVVIASCASPRPTAGPPAPARAVVADDEPPNVASPELTAAALPHRVAATVFTTCIIDREHAAWCSGHQLAEGGGDVLVPRRMLEGIAAITGHERTCALRTDGHGSCNTDPGRAVTGAIEADAGTSLACALFADTHVECWGREARDARPPVRGATQLAVGETHACARIADGTAYCWGSNAVGQLASERPDARAVRVPLTDVAGVAAGSTHSCAWRTDGSVWCWGDRDGNALGDAGRARPQPVPGLANIIAVRAGYALSCAIDRDGALWCWGHNAHGELVEDGHARGPTRIALPAKVVEVSTGGHHVCARDEHDDVWCWGQSSFGQLGTGDVGVRPWPERIRLGAPREQTERVPPRIVQVPSGATRVEFAATRPGALAEWQRIPGGHSAFVDGALELHAFGFEEWALHSFAQLAGTRWAVEARVALAAPCDKPATGIRVDAGTRVVSVALTTGAVVGAQRIAVDTTTPHTIRIEVDGDTSRLLVDGRVVGQPSVADSQSGQGIFFGTFGDGCGRDRSRWYSLAYETYPARVLQSPR